MKVLSAHGATLILAMAGAAVHLSAAAPVLMDAELAVQSVQPEEININVMATPRDRRFVAVPVLNLLRDDEEEETAMLILKRDRRALVEPQDIDTSLFDSLRPTTDSLSAAPRDSVAPILKRDRRARYPSFKTEHDARRGALARDVFDDNDFNDGYDYQRQFQGGVRRATDGVIFDSDSERTLRQEARREDSEEVTKEKLARVYMSQGLGRR